MTPDRRMVLRAGLGATAALASPIGPFTAAAYGGACDFHGSATRLAATPQPVLRPAKISAVSCVAAPQAVVRPKSSAGIAKVVQWAAARKLKVAARGHGHSVYGRALAEGGIVIDMTSIDAIGAVGSPRDGFRPHHESVGAGTTWADVLDATLARDLTPPVLTNYLDLTVGGTIVIGGIGGSSPAMACRPTTSWNCSL